MRITSKGQVTIPQDIRDRFGFLPETEVDFRIEGDAVRLDSLDASRDGEVVEVSIDCRGHCRLSGALRGDRRRRRCLDHAPSLGPGGLERRKSGWRWR